MKANYNKLLKMLIDKKMTKTELREKAKISSSTLAKIGKEEMLSTDVLIKICDVLNCDIGDIVELAKDKKEEHVVNSSYNKLKVVSLFSGIGGFEAGLQKSRIDAEVIFASEIDAFARKSYTANFPSCPLFGDITKITEKSIPEHDLLVAGFPCQSFSIAGKRKGFNDIRGTLFFDVARILSQKNPKFVLLENVKNLISHDKTSTIKTILNTLNEIGYTVDFTIINSVEAGVPQNRDRTYICGVFNGKKEQFQNDIRSTKVTQLKQKLNDIDFYGFNFFNNVKFTSKQKYIKDILEKEVDEAYYFNTPEISEFLLKSKIPLQSKCEAKIVKLLDIPREIHNDLERQRRVYSIYGISPTVLARSDSTKILVSTPKGLKVRKITSTENFYIQGFDKEFVNKIKETGMSITQMYKQSGNAVSPPVITGILNCIHEELINND